MRLPPLYDAPVQHQSYAAHAIDAFWHYPGMQGALLTAAGVACLYASVQIGRYALHRKYRADDVLPDAPTPYEHYSYFQKQWRRSLTVLYGVLGMGGLYGLWSVFSKSWVWYPFLVVSLGVMLPWTWYTIAVALRRPVINADTHSVTIRQLGRPGTVDVFITVCGEERAVVDNTFNHVARLNWPAALSVYVLDDSKDEGLRGLAEGYGFTYVRRPNRPDGKKSGNLNYGMSQSHGDYIVVFDADFCPDPAFLLHTIPYFDAPDVGIVQTSQYFDISRTGTVNWMARLSGVVQGMFFCWAQPGQQAKNAAFCVGTNVCYRRAALDVVGGVPWCPSGGEDVVTSVRLLREGMRTVYVPLNLARGLCPDTWSGTINQQYRWCLTTLALLFPLRGMATERHSDSFWCCKMTLTQRISYLAGLLYYGQSMLALLIACGPALIMLWDYPYQIGPGNYLPIAPAMLSMLTLPLMVPGWRPEMLRLAIVYGVAHLLAFTDAITGRVQGWVPSGSAVKVKKNNTPRRAAVIVRGFVLATQGLTWWALVRDIPVYGLPAYWIPAVLAVMQTAVLLPLLLPDYGTVGVKTEFRRMHAYLVGKLCSTWRSAGRGKMDLLRESARRRESGAAILRARSSSVQSRRSGAHRKSRQRDLRRLERSIPVSVGEGVDEREVPVALRTSGCGGQRPGRRAGRMARYLDAGSEL